MGNLSSQQDHALTFSLLAIGEIGRNTDLSQISSLKSSLLAAFLHQAAMPQHSSHLPIHLPTGWFIP
jgi:hypothetical protein